MKTIELKKEYRGGNKSTTFSGRSEGADVRKKLELDSIEDSDNQITVKIPNYTTSFNPSFFLGLFYESVKKCGTVDAFKSKFTFDLSDFSPELRDFILEDLNDCYIRCNNELNKKTAIDL